jgi:hypothetical protein
MRKTVAKCVVAMGAGFALIVGQGCRKQAAPVAVQPAVRVPRVQPDLRVGSLPVGSLGPYGPPKVDRVARHPAPVQRQETQGVDTEATTTAQMRQDASLLLQQQAASQKQQQELNQEIEEEMKRRQEVQEELRIQSVPSYYVPVQPPTSTPQP